ncbi:glycerate kinase family protein [Burkholderia cenocepacia]|uniref:glycerate kinase family protein n=1 Tax=Burkholderia cenocepacia TaxID=95486 RepID=UPI00098259F0|nr:glycerate kinase [Burkholderia cenocepacia]ONS65182.1 glycerate kinase [Burkholderia cenocepacia]
MASRSTPVIVVAPDSFKGSLSALEAAQAMARGIRRAIPCAVVLTRPMADGGEGTLDAMMGRASERVSLTVRGASGRPQSIEVGLTNAHTAIVESACILGLTDILGVSVSVEERSSHGVGEVVRHLLDRGARRFLVALGGTSTNDAGAGFLAALGIRFLDANDHEVTPLPRDFDKIVRVDAPRIDPRLSETSFLGMTDVDNPLTGPRGATCVFGPQKGLTAESSDKLDNSLLRIANLLEETLSASCLANPGAGAAGGLGFAILLLGGSLQSGADAVAREIGLRPAADEADWLITGERRSDTQTLGGKAPFVASAYARAAGIPCTLLSGSVAMEALPSLSEHFAGCFSASIGPMSLENAIDNAAALLENAAQQLANLRYTCAVEHHR